MKDVRVKVMRAGNISVCIRMEITAGFDSPEPKASPPAHYALALIMKNRVFSFKEEPTLSIKPQQLFQKGITAEQTGGFAARTVPDWQVASQRV